MKNLPLLSVIVPVYRVENYLDCCLTSLTGQTYENIEILLVDDGSPDRSGAICDAWAEKDSRVKVIHQENRGGGAARNAALDVAKGELIAFVDSDDYIAPDMFSHLYGLLETGADIAECAYLDTAEDGVCFPQEVSEPRYYTPEEAMQAHIEDRAFRQLIWNKLYRREMVGSVRFPVGTKIDDEYFTYQVLGNAKRLVLSDKVCYAYRQQPGSIMHSNYDLKRLEGILAMKQRLFWIQENMPALEDTAKEYLLLYCLYSTQSGLRYLNREDYAKAKQIIDGCMEATRPFSPQKGKTLLKLIQFNVTLTARLLNFLIDIHVLD